MEFPLNAAHICICVESHFKLLCIDLPIFIQDMRVDLRNHIALSVTGVSLRCLDIPFIDFELISCTRMTKGVKDNIWEAGGLFQALKLIPDDPILTGAAGFLRQNQVINSLSVSCFSFHSRRI